MTSKINFYNIMLLVFILVANCKKDFFISNQIKAANITLYFYTKNNSVPEVEASMQDYSIDSLLSSLDVTFIDSINSNIQYLSRLKYLPLMGNDIGYNCIIDIESQDNEIAKIYIARYRNIITDMYYINRSNVYQLNVNPHYLLKLNTEIMAFENRALKNNQ